MSFQSGRFPRAASALGPAGKSVPAHMVPHFARVPLITEARCLGALSSQVSSAGGLTSLPVEGHCVEIVCQPFLGCDEVVSFSFAECEGVLQFLGRVFVCCCFPPQRELLHADL